MARQNIDEIWKTDPRRRALAKQLGSERLADGMRVEINWLILDHKGQSIPLKKFQFVEDYEAWINCGLAEVKGDQVEIAGADRYSEFFEKQHENGSKGGRPLKPKRTQKNPKEPNVTQTNPTITESNPNNPSFSFSSSFSSSISKSPPEGAKTPTKGNPVVSEYYREWQSRYPGERPVVLPHHQKFLKDLGDQEGIDRACKYVRAYLSMPDPWFMKKRHDVETLRQNLNAVSHFLSTGKVITKKIMEGVEEQVDKAQGTDKKLRRSIEELERERAEMMAEANGLTLLTGGER